MPAITFGLASKKGPPKVQNASTGQKRKQNPFDDEDDEPGDDTLSTLSGQKITSFGGISEVDDFPPPSKSPKLGHDRSVKSNRSSAAKQYANLSALHAANKHTEQASTVDSTMYDYDAVYDTFQASKKKTMSSEESKKAGPKYMTNLLKSAEVRKRDQLRAKERLLQQEREAEGDEFADKDKFVTGAYKAQQEEMRRLEEEEVAREAMEEEKRKKGGGMTGFYKDLLHKDEERSKEISKAVEEAATQPKVEDRIDEPAQEKSAEQVAKEMNAEGARVAINDEGEVVDKRQLLSAGLNVAPKPKPTSAAAAATNKASAQGTKPTDYRKTTAAWSARESQRERQTRMMATQLEVMAEQQAQAEVEEQEALQEKAKSRKSGADISSAKERYLARKREQEAQQEETKVKSVGS